MKTLTSFIICLVFGTVCCYGQTPNNHTETEQNAEQMLQMFYTKYLTVFATADGVAGQKKLEMLQKQFCVPAFFKKIPAIIKQTDSDPFLKAQDTSIDYLKTLSVSKTLIKNNYRVSYIGDAELGKKSTVVIQVTVVMEKGEFKIAALK
jgi:hypothetical protein